MGHQWMPFVPEHSHKTVESQTKPKEEFSRLIVSGSERTSKSKHLPVATKGGLILEVPRSNFHQDETKSRGLDNANGQGGSDFLALIAKGIKPSGERKKYHRFAAPPSFAGKDAEQRLGGALQQHMSLYNQSLIRLVSCG
jgi:hypothetical protein